MDRLMKKFLSAWGWKFLPLEYVLLPTQKNEPLFDIRGELDLFFCTDIAPKIQKQTKASNYISDYERKRIYIFLEFLSKKELYHIIELLHVIRNLRVSVDDSLRVLLARTQWSREVKLLFKRNGYNAEFFSLPFSCGLKRRNEYLMDYLVRQSLRCNLNFLFKIAYVVFNISWDCLTCVYLWLLRHFKPLFPRSVGNFDIVAHVPGYNRTEWYNELFWKRDLAGNVRTLAVLFGSLDKSAYASYGYLADGWVSLNKASHSCRIHSIFHWMWPMYPKVLLKNLAILLKVFSETKAKNYYWFEIVRLYIEISKMEALFRMAGNRIFWTSIEGQETTTVAGAIAINRLNGVAVGSTWSMPSFSEFNIYKNAVDVFFIWGRRHLDIYRKETCKTLIISGYIGDFYLRSFLDRAACLRDAWRKKYDAQKIICCYDNIFGNDIQHFTLIVLEYFSNLLRWVRKSPGKLLVIKAKHGLNYYPEPFLKEFKVLENQRKLIFEFNKADLSPGLASDVVISPGMSTLACLSAAYGKDVILLDANRMNSKIPIGIDSIVYITAPSDIAESLDNCLSGNRRNTDKSYIAITPNPSRLDPFVDGLASERISGYIADLISELNKGLIANMAIQAASLFYGNKWGHDKVINSESFVEEARFSGYNEACVNN